MAPTCTDIDAICPPLDVVILDPFRKLLSPLSSVLPIAVSPSVFGEGERDGEGAGAVAEGGGDVRVAEAVAEGGGDVGVAEAVAEGVGAEAEVVDVGGAVRVDVRVGVGAGGVDVGVAAGGVPSATLTILAIDGTRFESTMKSM